MSFGFSWVGVHFSPPDRTAGSPGSTRRAAATQSSRSGSRLLGAQLLRRLEHARAGCRRSTAIVVAYRANTSAATIRPLRPASNGPWPCASSTVDW